VSYRSSAQAFSEFMDSTIWDDILQELNAWLDDVHKILEDPSGDANEKALYRLGGNAETIRNVMRMPEVIRDSIIEDRKEPIEEVSEE